MEVTFKDAALKYAKKGWPIFPCQPRGKTPLTPHGLHDATTDTTKVTTWWTRLPDANIALRTGACARIIVVDVDGEEGYETLRDLERSYSQLPRTASVKTPRGGQHFYFRHPGGHIPNSAGQLGPGLDIRGDGGYVLAPPSVGPNGNEYEPDERVREQPPPPWLLALLEKLRPKRGRKPPATWVRMIREGLPEGQRNGALTSFVGHLLARDVDIAVVREVAHLLNETRCKPSLSDREVDRVVESIFGRELRKRAST